MKIEEINETVQVISYFDGRTTRPLRFQWRGRAYRVARINGVWDGVKGRAREYHYHVATRESGSFELIFNNAGMSWKIGRVSLDDS
jgi:hypothetical protein